MEKNVQLRRADNVSDSAGRQYHIACAPGEVASHIVLCGDPARANLVAQFFSKVEHENRYREYVTITGIYQGVRMSVCATGIGPDNTEIAMVELSHCVKNPKFLRLGTCGALRKEINITDMVISTGALRYENTSGFFVPPEYPAIAHYSMVQKAVEQAKKAKIPYHTGLTATCSGFYGAQERTSGSYEPWEKGRLDKLAKIGVLNLEMEASALLVLASIRNFQAGVICTVFANRVRNEFIEKSDMKLAEERLVELGLKVMLSASQEDAG